MHRMIHLLAALIVVAAGLGPAAWSHTGGRAYTVQTVQVSELGFNPQICRMNREYVRFHNVSSKTIRVGRPSAFANEPPIDIRELKPGEFSNEYSIPHGGTTKFIDVDNPSHEVTVVTPVFVMYWEPICTPDPNFVPPQPPCRTNPYCLRLPLLSID